MTKFKKMTALILSLVMLFSLAVISAQANEIGTGNNDIKITVSSNTGATASQTYDTTKAKFIIMKLSIETARLLASGQGYITYDNEYLKVNDIVVNSKIKNPTVYSRIENKITFNFQTINDLYEFKESDIFISIKFDIVKAGETTVNVNYTEFTSLDDNDVPVDIVADSTVVDGEQFKDNIELSSRNVLLRVNSEIAADPSVSSPTVLNTSTQEYDLEYNKYITVNIGFDTSYPIRNIKGYLKYDSNILKFLDGKCQYSDVYSFYYPNNSRKEFNINLQYEYGNNPESIPFPQSNKPIATMTFEILKAGEINLDIIYSDISIQLESDYLYIVRDGKKKDNEYSSDFGSETKPSEEKTIDSPTTPTDPTPPTAPGTTTLKLTAPKKSMYIGSTMIVKTTITNQFGSVKYEVSNTKIATIDANGKIKAKHKGNLTVKARNNGKVASVKIKVLQRNNPVKVKVKKKVFTAKANKKTTLKKKKLFKITKAKGKVVFYRASKNIKFSVKKNGNLVIAKGLKKGKTYTVKVKVVAKGNTTYKKKAIIRKVKIKIK